MVAVFKVRRFAHRHRETSHKNQWVNLMCSAAHFCMAILKIFLTSLEAAFGMKMHSQRATKINGST
jgi:hypothetical protein